MQWPLVDLGGQGPSCQTERTVRLEGAGTGEGSVEKLPRAGGEWGHWSAGGLVPHSGRRPDVLQRPGASHRPVR
jgi:hypothetical protein